MEIIGPRGTQRFCEGLLREAYRDDIDSRRVHPLYSEHGSEWLARDVLEDELTLEEEGYSIRMVHVLHIPQVLDNLAYRIEADGRSLVVVGDTIRCDALDRLAEGCDLLVHECTFPSERIERHKWSSYHVPPRELGRWARERGVKRLMLKHFAVQEGVTVEGMVDEVRSEFGESGLIVGEDLMSVEV
jgi:ribonuclease Z